jgi:hypothetical protein
MQTFYSQEAYDEYQRDLAGDGYTNEFQRCFEESRIRRPIKNERPLAQALHAAGRVVVCANYEVCCPVTDALIGYDFVVLGDYASVSEAALDTAPDWEGPFIFEPEPPQEAPVASARADDDIPF